MRAMETKLNRERTSASASHCIHASILYFTIGPRACPQTPSPYPLTQWGRGVLGQAQNLIAVCCTLAALGCGGGSSSDAPADAAAADPGLPPVAAPAADQQAPVDDPAALFPLGQPAPEPAAPAAPQAPPFPEDVAAWTRDDLRRAKSSGELRIVDAISAFCKKSAPGDTAVAELLVELLKTDAAEAATAPAEATPDAGDTASVPQPGELAAAPKADLSRIVEPIINCLGTSATPLADETLRQLLLGSLPTHLDPVAAVSLALAALAANATPAHDEILLAVMLLPESDRAPSPDGNTPLDARILEAVGSRASPEWRLKLAESLVQGSAPETRRQRWLDWLSAPQVANLPSQIALLGAATVSDEAKNKVQGNLAEFSGQATDRLLGIPADASASPAPSTVAEESPTAEPEAVPQTEPREKDRTSAKADAANDFLNPTPQSIEPEEIERNAREMRSRRQRDRAGEAPQAEPSADTPPDAEPGEVAAGPETPPADGTEKRAAETAPDSGMPLADAYFVASTLWHPAALAAIVKRAENVPELGEAASLLRLAASLPLPPVRARQHALVKDHWTEGTARIKDDLPFGTYIHDPGLLLVAKSAPRKSDPSKLPAAKGRPARAPRPADEIAPDDKAKYEWMQACEDFVRVLNRRFYAAALALNSDTVAPAEQAVGEGQPPQDTAAADPSSSSAAESAATAPASPQDNYFRAEGGADRPLPIELHEGASVLAEYHLKWPDDLAAGRLPNIQISPLIVHYIRVEQKVRPVKLKNLYQRQLKSTSAREVADGFWLDHVTTGNEPGTTRSIDVLITRANKDDDEPPPHTEEQDVIVEILAIEIPDPART